MMQSCKNLGGRGGDFWGKTLLTNPPPSGWRPSYKYYNTWVSLFGSLLCAAVMFITSWWTALITVVIIYALYRYIQYRKPGEFLHFLFPLVVVLCLCLCLTVVSCVEWVTHALSREKSIQHIINANISRSGNSSVILPF
jgi:energy-coupling factor transporter transmembrane protein EcfT